MTKLNLEDKVIRETHARYKGRPIVIELRAGVVVYRLKGTRQAWALDHEVGIEAAMKVDARERLKERGIRI
jgi:hypothetical protein